MHTIRNTIRQAPIPLALKAYYQKNLCLRSKSGPKVKDVLCTTRLRSTLQQMREFIGKPCACNRLQGVNKVEGCVSTRMPSEWVTATAPTAQVAQQFLGNRMLLQWDTLQPEVERAAVKVMRALWMPRDLAPHAVNAVVTTSQKFHDRVERTMPWQLMQSSVQRWKKGMKMTRKGVQVSGLPQEFHRLVLRLSHSRARMYAFKLGSICI